MAVRSYQWCVSIKSLPLWQYQKKKKNSRYFVKQRVKTADIGIKLSNFNAGIFYANLVLPAQA